MTDMKRKRSSRPRRAKSAQGHSPALFQLLVESAKEYAIFTTDPKGLITSWNAGAERISGYSEKEALGKNAALFFVPEDRQAQEHEKELKTAAGEGRAVNERWHIKKDGTRFWGSGFVR